VSALTHLPIKKVEEGWLMVMKSVPQNEKVTLFLDYFVEQRMGNQNVPIEMWNINNHRHTTDSAIEGANFKLNSIIGGQQPNMLLLVQTLKEQAELESWQLQSKDPEKPGQKRRKADVKQEQRIKKIYGKIR
jgi:hypothetical protein